MEEEATTLNAAGGRIASRLHARDLNLVMGPAAPGTSQRFRVGIDGQPPGPAHGTDVDADGNGILPQQRVYQLICQPGPITDHTFEITFPDPGAQAYCASPSDKSREKPKSSAAKRWPPGSSSATRPPKCTSATSTKSSVCIPVPAS
jgi:thioredoxin family protein